MQAYLNFSGCLTKNVTFCQKVCPLQSFFCKQADSCNVLEVIRKLMIFEKNRLSIGPEGNFHEKS